MVLAESAADDLASVWGSWPWDGDVTNLVRAAGPTVTAVTWEWQDVAAGITADRYDDWRNAERIPGRFAATPAALAAEDQVLAGLRFAAGSLLGADPDVTAARSLLTGAVSRHVMHGGNDTIVESTRRDPQASGWVRFARGGACNFCRMIASRGAVFKRATASFAAHSSCRCVSAPSWDADAPEVPAVAYTASKRTRSAVEKQQVRDYLATNYPT